MAITAVEVRLLGLAQVEPFAAASGQVAGQRPLTVVRVTTDGGEVGWGECEALPEAGYTPEWAVGAFACLRDELAPALLGSPASPDVVRAQLGRAVGWAPMAVAALEQAVLDLELRRSGRSLAEHLGVGRRSVPAGAVAGFADDVDVLVDRVGDLVRTGYRRVKVKIRPGWDLAPLRALRSAWPDLELQADANGSYDEATALDRLAGLGDLGLTCLEQPLPATDRGGAARLRRRLGVPLAADESVASPAAVEQVLAAGAADIVVVKPARLGGLAVAASVHDRCRDAGVPLMAGGLLEAGLGRRALVAVAALPGFTVTGDCSPADRWLSGDPWPPMELVDGRVPVHDGPGVAPPPDPDQLDRVTLQVASVRRT